MSFECLKCQGYGLKYDRKYEPSDFLEGKRSSRIWIVGLNPKLNPKDPLGQTDCRDATELEDCLKEGIHLDYFRDFEKVSQKLYAMLGKEGGVAHTDIVKCFFQRWLPNNCKAKGARAIVRNCQGYLEKQIGQYSPQIIICNGSAVCRTVREIIEPRVDVGTSYIGNLGGKEIAVILSGFIGRIDDYAKLRLGKEIESYMAKYGIG